ncbi:2-phospho-L-lactate guanylyltransferase [Blastococcus sp. TF02A-26]|uniref:2-phospho-L-lactate guanylyltransferase n=1 Tax=Blastococcus sp. TF02A-26 TaxID=2250577 RepID=UPI001F1CD6BC|nr:2-phospho-L-lactate guanylyltransferase [Blastococcus sp. TF02A-26]
MEWSVVVPAKRLAVAKTRLSPLTATAPDLHAELVLALLADTVTAALGTADAEVSVADVVVVTDDVRAAALVTGLGARTVGDEPDRGLNPALAHGAGAARTAAVAALSSDLPALRPAELAAALRAAEGAGRALVADAAGTGTTLLAARGGELRPRFGAGSAAAHTADGALPLAGDWPGLRRDVDTAADLAEAVRLGVGRHTAALLLRLPAVPGRP